MATVRNPSKALMGSFKELGLTTTQVRHFVPDWWVDDAALEEGGLLELQILLARRLNVALESLQSTAPKPVFREATRRFKTVHPNGSTQLAVAAGVGHGLAQVLANACRGAPLQEQLPAAKLRGLLLKDKPSVTLDGLCTWLWDHGVPVLHITNWPRQLRRPDAMCVRVGDRPVILVVRNENAPARLTYLIAHEVGHVMSGHLRSEGNTILVDDTLPVDEQGFAKDDDEKVADQFAMELLGGKALKSVCEGLVNKHFNEVKLAVAALQASKGSGLDAGQVILGWARLTGDWKLAGMAMRYLMTTQPAPVVVNDVAKRYVHKEQLASDSLEHLSRLSGVQFGEE
jgi:hypothetical protein